jgi:Carbohydrate binding module (family 6)
MSGHRDRTLLELSVASQGVPAVKKLVLASLLLCLAFVGDPRPGLAATWNADSADLLDRLEKEGWQTVQPGVMQRKVEGDVVETLGFGADGLRFKLEEMKAHLAYLRKEHALHPSPELRLAIRAHRAEILRVQAALKGATTAGKLESASDALVATGANCTANYDAIATLPLGQGVSANASASFNNACGYIGEVYAHTHAKATTPKNEVVTMTKSNPAPNTPSTGVNVTAAALAAVNGVTDCYMYAYASVTSYDLGLTYSQSASSSACPDQTPFRGTPFAVPGTIKAADFDNGGDGVAYHEVTPSTGSGYRATGVDLADDIVVWLDAGDWLEYTVDVVNAGTYTLVAQVSAIDPGGSFHVELDGTDVTGRLAVPVTTSRGLWGSAVKPGVSMPAGRHVLRVVADSWFDGFSSLRILKAQTPFGGTPRTLPGTIWAVEFDEGGEQIAYHDTTAGCNGNCSYRNAEVDHWDKIVYHTRTGEWMEYTVNVTATGTYTLTLRVAAAESGAIFHVEFDGVDVTGPLTMPTTGKWNTFQIVTKTGVSLPAGKKVMRIVVDSDGGHSDAGSFDTITIQP